MKQFAVKNFLLSALSFVIALAVMGILARLLPLQDKQNTTDFLVVALLSTGLVSSICLGFFTRKDNTVEEMRKENGRLSFQLSKRTEELSVAKEAMADLHEELNKANDEIDLAIDLIRRLEDAIEKCDCDHEIDY